MVIQRNEIMFAFYPLFVRWSHAIALLSSMCKTNGIHVEMCILPGNFEAMIQEYKGELVGFSCTIQKEYDKCIPFIRMAKSYGKTILLGGTWAGLNRPVIPEVDLVCRGDGEYLAEYILEGDELMFHCKAHFMGLDRLPLPDYEIFKDIPFVRGFPTFEGKKVLPYMSSRGCTHRCSFCQIVKQPPGIRLRRRVEEDLSIIQERYRPDMFFIGDCKLPYHDKKWRESWGDFHHPFACYIRADIPKYQLEWLIDRGMKAVSFGIESGDEAFRNNVLRKDLTDRQIFSTIDALKHHGVEFATSFIANYPGEKFAVKSKTHEMIQRIKGMGAPVMVWEYEEL